LDLKHWETYYRGGALATFPTGPGGTYDQELREAWTGFFGDLPDGARILDVGTGNGAVALIARETATELGRRWEIEATDKAQIDPHQHVPDGQRLLQGVRFHAGVGTEELPFDDAHFDAVSGHYALEYMDVGAALAEIHRVLKPGGRAQFILHHADSLLTRSANVSLREGELVLRETKVYRRLAKLVALGQVAPAVAERAAADLRVAIRTLKNALASAQQAGGGRILKVTLDAVQKLLSARTSMRPEQVEREVGHAENEMRAAVRRLNDLVAHALDEGAMTTLERQAADAGFSVIERAPQYRAGAHLVGWRLLLRRT
jgi:ubiquinone/menaquinone biosynthesis C-methylase UbiE